MIKRLLLYSGVMLFIACGSTTKSDYLHQFYSERQAHMVGLVAGDRAPLKSHDLSHIQHYPYNDSYRVRATFEETPSAEPVTMATYSGNEKVFSQKGKLLFSLDGKKHTIYVYQLAQFANHPLYGQTYFIPFKDVTSGNETYGGGRYMDINKSLFANKKLVLDFNQAYNPWCAYADGYNCPIPPKENDLTVAIYAGEQNFHKDHH